MSSRSGRRSRVKRGARGQRLVDDLVEACGHDQVGKAKKLLRKGADPNGEHRGLGWTPLIAASDHGHLAAHVEQFGSGAIRLHRVHVLPPSFALSSIGISSRSNTRRTPVEM